MKHLINKMFLINEEYGFMKSFLVTVLCLMTVNSFSNEVSLFHKHQKISQSLSFFDDYSLEDIMKISRQLIDYVSDFHPALIQNLNDNSVLHGKQLTTFHEIASHFIGITRRLESIAAASKLKDLKNKVFLEQLFVFYKIYYPYYQNDEFRRYVNDEDLTFGLTRFQVHHEIMSLLNIDKIQILLSEVKQIDDEYESLMEFLGDKKSLMNLRDIYQKKNIADKRVDQQQDLTYRLSRDFGNTVGRVRWRKGYLWQNDKVYQELEHQLQPLDIISEKTYFALTDKFIPGHFGHNAIWVGTKEQLIALGMWSHPAIIPYQHQIEAGKNIMEVDRTGTHLKSLKDFMNVDEVAIFRINQLSFEYYSIYRIYDILLAQMGKIYDFNFDVETTDTLVCSELIYQSFEEVYWPTEPYLGRVTISPDNVASLALYDHSPLDLVYYAAQKSKSDFQYKGLDDLAHDMEFRKVDDKYKRVVKDCTHSHRNNCDEVLEDLIYSDHEYIPSLDITWNE